MKIGNVELENQVIAAPMAGISDKAFRILAKEAGCGLVLTEMISDKGLVYGNQKTWEMLDLSGERGPISVQIFGSEPETMAEAARIVVEKGASVVDINMGCPTPKIVKNGQGAALMKNVKLAGEIVRSVVKAVTVPVTVKMRKGWDEENVNAVEVAKRVQEAGAAAITIHGRTRSQFYAGEADWNIIREVKKAVDIPVIGNGDIWTPQDAERMLRETGCDGVMIGRAALGNPWIFRRTVIYLKTGELLPEPSAGERIEMALRHLNMVVELKGEKVGVQQMRKHIAGYIKGLRNAAQMRNKLNKLETVSEVQKVLYDYLKNLESQD
ncbi:tRNA dihydrouridine synthase DusB [Calderihabitans maritimus]|uniref:tRNA-dihydrouridine synthase n=1 Tax=Calderihabitans maritimus TaxID=1246530 RepID=A0A1Z5HTN0_9FIRM|nr:tRNA dihydrouridine synthase DusB [Calderihabitans maritimus]GAW92882.1 nifR3 family TIM-barrel protein [Calderihabitans maritimus]